jgi:DNA-binding CsgD family transcriptional regulator/tetrahydromethanopterin S-methyltransferase subunit G
MHGDRARRTENADVDALLDALDAIDQRVAFVDCGGRVLMGTAAMRRMLHRLPELQESLEEIVAELCRIPAGASIGARIARREVTDDAQVMLLTGSYLPFHFAGAGPCILLVLERLRHEPLTASVLQRRFGLTRQEARAARLLGLGLSNEEIAARLCISPHTARHHIQRIAEKLDAPSRAALVSMLLNPPE